jgi:hypothetical protein
VRQSMLAKTESASLAEADLNSQVEHITKEVYPTINQLVTQRNYWKEMAQSQLQVISVQRERLAELEQKLGRKRTKAPSDPRASYDAAFTLYSGALSRLHALQELLSKKGIDDPIISELIESFRCEIAKLEARIKEFESAEAARQTTDADD